MSPEKLRCQYAETLPVNWRGSIGVPPVQHLCAPKAGQARRADLRSSRRLSFACALLISTFGQATVKTDSVSPGLLAEYRTLVPGSTAPPLVRLDPKPAFFWGDSSPHPSLPPGPFRVRWKGVILLKDEEAPRFSLFLGGQLKFTVDGVKIFDLHETDPMRRIDSAEILRRGAGNYSLEIEYKSLPNVPARVQLWWEGTTFSLEPLVASHLRHAPNQLGEDFHKWHTIERGRQQARIYGCAHCHHDAFPGIRAAPHGPALSDLRARVQRDWLISWLRDPAQIRSNAIMPRLFSPDRQGSVEISLISDYLLGDAAIQRPDRPPMRGDHRNGRQAFVGLGCATCHILPDRDTEAAGTISVAGQEAMHDERTAFQALADRFTTNQLAAFISNPRSRYPNGKMPRLPVSDAQARDIAAYLLLWSKPLAVLKTADVPPTEEEVNTMAARLGEKADRLALGAALVREKRCAACHAGIGETQSMSVPLRVSEIENNKRAGCLGEKHLPSFSMSDRAREEINAFASLAAAERHFSPFEARQQLLRDSACFVCHQLDGDQSPLMEHIGQSLWTPHLMRLPYQRTPRLTGTLAKYTRSHLLDVLKSGSTATWPSWYSYRMPLYAENAEQIVAALAERDGYPPMDLPATGSTPTENPTLSTFGASLVGFEGYSCVSCHIWKSRELTTIDPAAVGPELTTVTLRIQRTWFDRWLEDPGRVHPGTPMPAFFPKGRPAPLASVLDGDASKQKDAIWSYLSQGTNAPSPQPRSLIPIVVPGSGEPPVIAQIPLRLPNGNTLESLCLQYSDGLLAVYDLSTATLHSLHSDAQILRDPNGWRRFSLSGSHQLDEVGVMPALQVLTSESAPANVTMEFRGYDRLSDGARLRFRISCEAFAVEIVETLRQENQGAVVRLRRDWRVNGLPSAYSIEIKSGLGSRESGEASDLATRIGFVNAQGRTALAIDGKTLALRATPDESGSWSGGFSLAFPPMPKAQIPRSPAFEFSAVKELASDGTKLMQRPGYRAIRYPMPKTAGGEDRIMPSALAVNPRTGRLFIASLKLGELFTLDDPTGNAPNASFRDHARGLFQEAYSMLHDGDALYVLHRRNLTRITDSDDDGYADRFDRWAALPHRAGNSYDWAYGLVRKNDGSFVVSFAPHADNRKEPGMGGVMRLALNGAGADFTEIAYGLRNAFGWTSGPEDEVFFSDNQGEWIAANKLGHLVANRYYGYPNSTRPEIAKHPPGETAVWVPYAWAKSINGITYNATGDKFGPFGGQIFMAELMHGGAIIRANLEKVNGVYQGACFPFWGQGLLGPLVLTFDPGGRLYVGSLTQPGWMAQPDRGALFRIDFTGEIPFEIQSIRVLPRGFQLRFTKPVSAISARDPASYSIEHYRYEYTGAYGSPEIDRTPVKVAQVAIGTGDREVDLITGSLVAGRIYSITAHGVKASAGESLVYPTGVYTLNQVPGNSRAKNMLKAP